MSLFVMFFHVFPCFSCFSCAISHPTPFAIACLLACIGCLSHVAMQTSKASAELEKTKKEMAAAVAGEKAEKRAAISALDAEKAAKAMLEKHHGSVSLPWFFSFLGLADLREEAVND